MGDAASDLILGRLTWDESMGSWVGAVELFPGHQIEVFIDFDKNCDSQEVVLSQARAWVARVQQREPEYRRWVAGQLVEGRWNTDEPMTSADIERLLRVASLVCAPDGVSPSVLGRRRRVMLRPRILHAVRCKRGVR